MSEPKSEAMSISVPLIKAEAKVYPPTITMKSNMWLHWGHIAARSEVEARKAHSKV